MKGDMRIALVEINGETRVPPEVMRILGEMAAHRDVCEQCSTAYKQKNVYGYCETSLLLTAELESQPEVTRE